MESNKQAPVVAALALLVAVIAAVVWWSSRETDAPPEEATSEGTGSGQSESGTVAATPEGMDASVPRPSSAVEGQAVEGPEVEGPDDEVEPGEVEAFDELLSARLEELRAELATAESIGATPRAEELRAQITRLVEEANEVRRALGEVEP